MPHEPASCQAFHAAMEVLAKPWTGLVFEALDGGPLRFSELRDAVGAIGDRMLSVRLRELEQRALVHRCVIHGPPVRVEYDLTEAGRGFREVAKAIRSWGGTILAAEANAKVEASAPPSAKILATKTARKTSRAVPRRRAAT